MSNTNKKNVPSEQVIKILFYKIKESYFTQINPEAFVDGEGLFREDYGGDWRGVVKMLVNILRENNQVAYTQYYKHKEISQSLEDKAIAIVLARTQDLCNAAIYDNIASEHKINGQKVQPIEPPLRIIAEKDTEVNYSNGTPTKKCLEENNLLPMLMIGTDDIMGFYSDFENEEARREYLKAKKLDSRFKFFDSSIWHRYVPLFCRGEKDISKTFTESFKEVLNAMIGYHEQELYASYVARTYLEYQTRMMKNSYLVQMGGHQHAFHVTPFKFHSETEMRRKSLELIKNYFEKKRNNTSFIKTLQWRMLLVDDYAHTRLPCVYKNKDKRKDTKLNIIRKLIEKDGFDNDSIELVAPLDEDEKAKSYEKSPIKNVIANTEQLLKTKMYDIVLLDYLLGQNGEGEEPREYGYELLKMLNKEQGSFQQGPLGRFWILPISSFPYALPDMLKQLGFGHLDDLWHLSTGADPISSPELFRYKLYSFMKMQIEESFITVDGLKAFFKRYPYKKSENIRSWAFRVNRAYNNKIHSIGLLSLEKEKSVLAESLYQFTRSEDNRNYQLLNIFGEVLYDLGRNKLDEITIERLDRNMYYLDNNVSDYPDKIKDIIDAISNYLNDFKRDKRKMEEQICGVENVFSLSLEGSKCVELLENHIKELDRLRVLDLRDTDLKGLPKCIEKLNNLEELYIANNNLHTFPKEILSLGNLRVLDLSNCNVHFSANKKSNENKLESLEVLFLQNNSVKEIPIITYLFPNLQFLDIRGNYLCKLKHPHIKYDRIRDFLRSVRQKNNTPNALYQYTKYTDNTLNDFSTFLDKENLYGFFDKMLSVGLSKDFFEVANLYYEFLTLKFSDSSKESKREIIVELKKVLNIKSGVVRSSTNVFICSVAEDNGYLKEILTNFKSIERNKKFNLKFKSIENQELSTDKLKFYEEMLSDADVTILLISNNYYKDIDLVRKIEEFKTKTTWFLLIEKCDDFKDKNLKRKMLNSKVLKDCDDQERIDIYITIIEELKKYAK